MAIKISTATVYHGGRRRWFSMASAERADANSIINRHCDCYQGSGVWDGPSEYCKWHTMRSHEPAKFERFLHLLIVMFVRREA